MTVWKYAIPPGQMRDVVPIAMPANAKILHVAEQAGGALCLWALVDPAVERVQRLIRIAGTGHEIEEAVRDHHLGSVVMSYGLVWHVFDGGDWPLDELEFDLRERAELYGVTPSL